MIGIKDNQKISEIKNLAYFFNVIVVIVMFWV